MKMSLAITLLLQSVFSKDPPETGKFFYIDFGNLHAGKYSEHQVELMAQKNDYQKTYAKFELFVEPK